MRAVIFNRASRDKSGQAKSVKDQNTENNRVCSVNSWEVVATFTENNIGASKYSGKKRDEYQKLLKFLATGQADVLVCWEGSRNDRTLGGHLELRNILQDNNIKLCLDGKLLDLNDDDDQFSAGIDALVAEKEAARLRKRVLRGQLSNVKAGKPHTKPAYGYRSTGKDSPWEPDPATASVVREMYDKLYRGWTIASVARYLNEQMIPTPAWRIPKPWKQWSYVQVRQIVLNPAYIGKRVFRGAIVGDAIWPALVDAETYWGVHNRLTDPERLDPSKAAREASVVHLCAGTISQCGVCGKRLRHHKIKGLRYYTDDKCTSVKYEDLNELVEARVIARLSTPSLWAQIVSQATNRDQEVQRARAEREELKNELVDARALVKERKLSVRSFAEIESDLQAQIDKLKQFINDGIHPLLAEGAGPNAREVWDKWTIEQRREVIRTLYTIKVYPHEKGKRTPLDKRVEFIPAQQSKLLAS
jgi:site-specific DNA recombinase